MIEKIEILQHSKGNHFGSHPCDESKRLLVLIHLDLLLVKPDVETYIRLLEINYVEVVYKHIGEDGTQ